MTRIVNLRGLLPSLLLALVASSQLVTAHSAGQQAVVAASQSQEFAFVMFYRENDAVTQKMHSVLTSTLSDRKDATIVPIHIGDTSERALIKQFDATRIPMPAVAVIAPNGAICTVFPQRVKPQQLTAAIVSRGQAECLKALQDNKIVALCAQPRPVAEIPDGVRQFQADSLYKDRTQVVTVQASDPSEAKFLNQLRVPTGQSTSKVALMAPPGVMVGVFNSDVTYNTLIEKLVAAGKCCDDKNCKHHKAAAAKQRSRR